MPLAKGISCRTREIQNSPRLPPEVLKLVFKDLEVRDRSLSCDSASNFFKLSPTSPFVDRPCRFQIYCRPPSVAPPGTLRSKGTKTYSSKPSANFSAAGSGTQLELFGHSDMQPGSIYLSEAHLILFAHLKHDVLWHAKVCLPGGFTKALRNRFASLFQGILLHFPVKSQWARLLLLPYLEVDNCII